MSISNESTILSHLKDYEPNIVRRAKFHKLVCFVSFSFLFFFVFSLCKSFKIIIIPLKFLILGKKVSDAAKEVTDFLNNAVGKILNILYPYFFIMNRFAKSIHN